MYKAEQIFRRLSLQSIREYLMYGRELFEKDPRSFDERVLTKEDNVLDMLEEKFPDPTEYDHVANIFLDHVNTSKEVFMEIGMQCGFILAMQLMDQPKELVE